MLLCHCKLSQPKFSAPIPGHQVVCNSTESGLSSPFTEILQDHHQLLWSGCVVMCCQVVKPEVRSDLSLLIESPASQLLTGCVESIEPLGVGVTHGRRHQDLRQEQTLDAKRLFQSTLSAYFSWCSIQARAATSGGIFAWSAWFGSFQPRITSCSGPTSGSVVFAQWP